MAPSSLNSAPSGVACRPAPAMCLLAGAILAGAILAALTATGPAAAQPFESTWSNASRSAFRLLAAPQPDAPVIEAGIEIRLDPNFKTYWRTPGDSGLPPQFDWSGSENAAAVEVDFPAPVRFGDGAGVSVGYVRGVVLPVRVRAADPSRPVTLALRMDYAVCETLCVPASGAARLVLPATVRASSPHAARLAAARAAVPTSSAGDSALSVASATWDGPALRVQLRVPEGAGDGIDLFVEGPEGWVFGTARLGERSGAEALLVVPVEDRPRPVPPGPVRLRLTATLAAAAGQEPRAASETMLDLDAGALAR